MPSAHRASAVRPGTGESGKNTPACADHGETASSRGRVALAEGGPGERPHKEAAGESRQVLVCKACRSCGSSQLETVLSLGNLYVSNFVNEPDGKQYPRVPLELLLCSPCGLLQLRHTTPPASLYQRYWYKSGMNQSMRAALADVTLKAAQRIHLRDGDSVLDIGCNDGTLLRSYTTAGIRRVGFEPGQNLTEEARQGTDWIIPDFFHARVLGGERFKVITSVAMFYDLDDPNQFVSDVARSLQPDGLWVIEMHYLPSMLARKAFDAVCHEHLEYYSLGSLEPLLERHGLMVADVETNEVNGGSFRIYVAHRDRGRASVREGAARVEAMRAAEESQGLTSPQVYENFGRCIKRVGERLRSFLRAENARGRQVCVYGASTKGNTLLQYFELDHTLIRSAAERNPDKWGKYTVGTWIPIVPEEVARVYAEDFLVLPWHFMKEIQAREEAFLQQGGAFIVPLPEPRVIQAHGTRPIPGTRAAGTEE